MSGQAPPSPPSPPSRYPFWPVHLGVYKPQIIDPEVPPNAACVQCGYALTGLEYRGKCPECGLPVADSLRGDLLQLAGLDYLKRVRRGLSLVLSGILVLALLSFVVLALRWLAPPGFVDQAQVELAGSLCSTAMSLILLRGYWLFTTRDPGLGNTQQQDASRKLARTFLIIQALSHLLNIAAVIVTATARPTTTTRAAQAFDATMVTVSNIVFGLAILAWVLHIITLLGYTRILALRVPDAYIDTTAKRYCWLLPILHTFGIFACGLGPPIAMLLYWRLLARMHRHVRFIITGGSPGWLPGMR